MIYLSKFTFPIIFVVQLNSATCTCYNNYVFFSNKLFYYYLTVMVMVNGTNFANVLNNTELVQEFQNCSQVILFTDRSTHRQTDGHTYTQLESITYRNSRSSMKFHFRW